MKLKLPQLTKQGTFQLNAEHFFFHFALFPKCVHIKFSFTSISTHTHTHTEVKQKLNQLITFHSHSKNRSSRGRGTPSPYQRGRRQIRGRPQPIIWQDGKYSNCYMN